MPNLLTVLRIIFASLIALILIFFDSKIAYFISFILFSLAGITDYFDGWLARKKGQISDLGRMLDPIADKILVISTFIILMSNNVIEGFNYASSVFEGERSYSGKIFKVREHTERLFESARALDLKIPYSVEEIIDASYKAIELNNLTDAYLRPIVWRGSEMGVSAPNAKVHCAIAVWEWPSYFTPEEILKGYY